MQQRYYDPLSGRFLSVDPVGVSTSNGGNFNRYWYANNNPETFIDPDGRCTGSRLSNNDGTCAFGDGLTSGGLTTKTHRNQGVEVYRASSNVELDNPTGGGMRNDDEGLGHFGAPRGNSEHEGLDLESEVGQDVVAPISGEAMSYTGQQTGYPIVMITPSDPEVNIDSIRLLYVENVGAKNFDVSTVSKGDTIGTAVNLQDLGYSNGVTPHVHVRIQVNGEAVDPQPYFPDVE